MKKGILMAGALATGAVTANLDAILGKGDINIGISNAIAGNLERGGDVVHINNPTEISKKWRKEDVFYIEGDVPVSDSLLKTLTQEINTKFPNTQYTFFFMGENPSNFKYTNRDNNNLRGKDAVEFALSESLLGKTNLAIGRKHVVVWISFKKDNDGKRWARPLTSAEFDDLGIGESSAFSDKNGPIFSKALDQLKNGNYAQAVMMIANGYDSKYNELVSEKQAREKQAKEEHERKIQLVKQGISDIILEYGRVSSKYEEFLGKKPQSGWDAEIKRLLQSAEVNLAKNNPGNSLSALSQVKGVLSNLDGNINSYDSYGEKIRLIGEKIKKLNEDPFSHKARLEYDRANSLYDKITIDWKNKDFSYISTYNELDKAINEFSTEINDARVASNTKNILTYGGSSIAFLLTGIFGFLSNRKRKPTKDEFEKELSRWQETLNKAHNELLEEIKGKQEILSGLFEKSSGETKQKVTKLSQDVAILSVILPKLHDTLEFIKKEVGSDIGVNLFTAGGYNKGLMLLSEAPISINPTIDRLDENLANLLGGRKISTLSELASSMQFTFEGMVKEADNRIKDIREIFDDFAEADDNFQKSINNAMDNKKDLEDNLQDLYSVIGEKSSEGFPFITTFLNNFLGEIDKISKLYNSDKLGSYNLLLDINYKIKIFTKCIIQIKETAKSQLPYNDLSSLRLLGYETDWFTSSIADAYKSLGKESEGIFNSDIEHNDFEKITTKKTEVILGIYNDLKSISTEAKKRDLLKDLKTGISSTLEQTKDTLSQKYQISKEKLFKEVDNNPENYFTQIDELDSQVKHLLDEGNLIEASSSLKQIENLLSKVKTIIELTVKGFEIYETKKNGVNEVSKKINTDIQEADKILSEIKKVWSSEVLKLGEGDINQPNSDGDLSNNIEEITDNNKKLSIILGQADEYINSGASIIAIKELNRAEAVNEDSNYRILEIKQKYERLKSIDGENNNLIGEINSRLSSLANTQSETYITNQSKQIFLKILERKSDIEVKITQDKRNPFEVNIKLKSIVKDINELENLVKKDKQAYEYFVKELSTSNSILSQLEKESKEAQYDSYPDSKEAMNVFNEVPSIRRQFNELNNKLSLKHQDWNSLLKDCESLIKKIRQSINVLRENSENRQKAEEAIRRAKDKVREARNWSGDYGITINSNYGVTHFTKAEEAYANGNFDLVYSLAQDSYNSATRAINAAEEEVRSEKRRIQAEEEAAERERQRQKDEAAAREYKANNRSDDNNTGFGGGGSTTDTSSGFGGGGDW